MHVCINDPQGRNKFSEKSKAVNSWKTFSMLHLLACQIRSCDTIAAALAKANRIAYLNL